MKLVHVGVITTGLVIVVGVGLVAPALILPHLPQTQPVFLLFEITNSYNLPQWCNDLANVLDSNDVKAAVFITGKLAEQYPQCVTGFGNNVEIGSMAYDYQILPGTDYLIQLEQVQQGKTTIDSIGNIDSKIFKAPFSQTDENIYSLLSRSNILADFSYDDHFNVYENGQFVRYDQLAITTSSEIPVDDTSALSKITFVNSQPVSEISEIISEIKSSNVKFVSASEIIANPMLEGF